MKDHLTQNFLFVISSFVIAKSLLSLLRSWQLLAFLDDVMVCRAQVPSQY